MAERVSPARKRRKVREVIIPCVQLIRQEAIPFNHLKMANTNPCPTDVKVIKSISEWIAEEIESFMQMTTYASPHVQMAT